ncbi:MAG: hypothetical protein OXG65_02445 [Chloroflexi bacterium]|nr:hypothetical protein [Chloroflexota bacterium]
MTKRVRRNIVLIGVLFGIISSALIIRHYLTNSTSDDAGDIQNINVEQGATLQSANIAPQQRIMGNQQNIAGDVNVGNITVVDSSLLRPTQVTTPIPTTPVPEAASPIPTPTESPTQKDALGIAGLRQSSTLLVDLDNTRHNDHKTKTDIMISGIQQTLPHVALQAATSIRNSEIRDRRLETVAFCMQADEIDWARKEAVSQIKSGEFRVSVVERLAEARKNNESEVICQELQDEIGNE